MARGKNKRIEETCKQVWRNHRTAIRNRTTTIKSVWEDHVQKALGKTKLGQGFWPKDSWFTKRVAKWEKETPYEEVPKDTLVQPWGDDWGDDPIRVSVLTALFGHVQDILEGQDTNYRLEGFPKRVCGWAIRLSKFFDINSRRECLFLLRFAYRFEKENSIRRASSFESDEPEISDESYDDLIRWQQHKAGNLIRPRRTREHHQYKGPDSEPDITEIEEAYIWEQSEADLEMNLAFDVRGATAFQTNGNGEAGLLIEGKWIPISIELRNQETDRPITPQQVSPSSDVVPNKLIEVLRGQGFPIDEDHAGLGMVYTNPPEQEESKETEEELLDGAYRVISMATTDHMIMPVDIPREEFREPPPEIAEAFAETFAQARLRVAKEEAERAAATGDDHSGDEQTVLTKDGVLKLVSELLEDPGALSKEKAAELAMSLVATYDEILSRHTEG